MDSLLHTFSPQNHHQNRFVSFKHLNRNYYMPKRFCPLFISSRNIKFNKNFWTYISKKVVIWKHSILVFCEFLCAYIIVLRKTI